MLSFINGEKKIWRHWYNRSLHLKQINREIGPVQILLCTFAFTPDNGRCIWSIFEFSVIMWFGSPTHDTISIIQLVVDYVNYIGQMASSFIMFTLW